MHSKFSHLIIYGVFLLTFLFLGIGKSMAQQFPQKEGERQRYNVQIDIKKAYISGICLMLMEDGIIKASIVNEFGVSAMDFTYSPDKDKVELISVIGKLNKWYIRKLLKKDLRGVMHCLMEGKTRYDDTKFSVSYTFTPAGVKSEEARDEGNLTEEE